MSQPYLPLHNQKIIDVTDPSDWDATRLPGLKSVDSALRCQICKDYYHTPVMTGCCHTFCSECIRRSLVREQKCPVCRAAAQESQLRKNGAAQELVDAFGAARPLLMEVARESVKRRKASAGGVEDGTGDEGEDENNGYARFGGGGGPKRRRRRMDGGGAPDEAMNSVGDRRITRGSSSRVGSRPSSQPSSQNQVICLDDDDDEDYRPPPSSGMVACPICGQRMKEARVDSHIESGCPKVSPPSRKRLRGGEGSFFGSSKPQSSTPCPTPTNPPDLRPLPKIAFNMIKESALRSKLQELGIPSRGDKRTLQDRYNEWMTLWNANVDSTTPKNKKELLKELSVWDATNRAPVVEKTKAAGRTHEGWSESHKPHFDELIAKARASRGKPELVKESKDEKAEGEVEHVILSSAQADGASAAPTTPPDNTTPPTVIPRSKVPPSNATQSFQPDFRQPQYLDQAFTTTLHSTLRQAYPPPPLLQTYTTQTPPAYSSYTHVNTNMFTTNPPRPTALLGADIKTDKSMTMAEEDTSLIGLYGKRKYEEMEVGGKRGGGGASGGL